MNQNKPFNNSSHNTRKNHQQSNNQLSSNNSTSRTIHIGNISSYTTVESLQLLFSKYGQVTNIKLAGDPSYTKRFAFVEFVDNHQAKLSLSLDGTEFMGQNLKISIAKHDFNSKQNSASSNNNNGNNGNLTPLLEKPVVFPQLITSQNNNNKKKIDPIRKKKVESPETSTLPPNYLPPSPSSLYLGGLSPISNSSIVDNNSATSRTIHISGIDSSFSEDELLEYFSVYGDITNYRLCNNDQQSSNSNTQLQTKFAFLEYATTEQSLKALMVNGTLWGKSKLKVSHSKTAIQTPPKKSLIDKQYRDLVERTIHVGGIDVKLSQDHVKAFFEELCGAIHRIAMAGDTESYETRFCFIEFEDKQSSLRALRLSGCTIAGSVKQIKVSPSKSPIGYSKNKLMMIMGNNTSAPPSPLHHQLNQLNLNTPTLSPHHQLHTSTPPSSITTVLPNGMVAMAIPPNALTSTTSSNITTGIYNTSQNTTSSNATSFPTVFQWALTQPSQHSIYTTTPPNPSGVLTNTLTNQGNSSLDTQASFITYPQMIHPQYYFYTNQFPYLAIPPNYTINTNNISNQDVNNIEEDSENVKRKRDQHETLDETSNVLYQKKLKDK